jgi:twitching motility protein PilI
LVSETATESAAARSDDLLGALRALERRCADAAARLPQPEEPADLWAGVLFHVGETAFLAPLEEIAEVLDVPREITPVPATKAWFCGIANNRGTLLPIFDLHAFLFGQATSRNPRNRVIVTRQDEFPYGLLVRDLSGIRHFQASVREPAPPSLRDLSGPLIVGSFSADGESYPVFSPRRLGQDTRFNLAAT